MTKVTASRTMMVSVTAQSARRSMVVRREYSAASFPAADWIMPEAVFTFWETTRLFL